MYPGRIFHLDTKNITAIEITNHENGDSVVIDSQEEIAMLVEQFNDKRYVFWSFDGPLNVTPEIVHIYNANNDKVWFVGPNGVSDGLIVFYTNMEFITNYLDR